MVPLVFNAMHMALTVMGAPNNVEHAKKQIL